MTRVHHLAAKAVKDGVLVEPDNCERCKKSGIKLLKHHKDYSKPLEVTWLCTPCHLLEHKENPDLRDPYPAKGTQIYVSDETKDLIDKASTADSRTQDGEIKHLCKERLAEIVKDGE